MHAIYSTTMSEQYDAIEIRYWTLATLEDALRQAGSTVVSIVVSVVPLALALFAAACTEQSSGLGASLAWDGRGYTAVWGSPEPSPNQIAVQLLQTRRGDGARPQPTQVARVGALAAAPELAWNGSRFLLVLHHGSGAITAQPVAPDGAASDALARPLTQSALALCTPPVWLETSYGVAWAARTAQGAIEYVLARVSPDGTLLDVTTIDRGPSRAPACALQAGNHSFALSYVLDTPDHADPDDPDAPAQLMFARVDASGKLTLRRQLAAADGPVQPLRLRALGTGHALLYRARGPAPLHLVHLSGTGRPIRTLALPAGIRADTADFVAGPARFAAAWTEPGRVHLIQLDGDGQLIARDELARPGKLSRVRMAAQGDSCALTWTELEDRAVLIAGSSTCLAGDGTGGIGFGPLRVRDAVSPLRGRHGTAAPSLSDP
jgi:hypothetical protein